ncbi:MAG: SH3 domain-containing protein [Rhodobacteraceae bacterium]|nr:SH3 domain-containing protein [Paracoccaceae bacterium]
MGWAFFELSGGKDFKPRADPALSATALTPLAIPEPVEPVDIVTTSLVLRESPTKVVPTEFDEDVAITERSSEHGLVSSQLVDLTETPPVTLVSLEQGGEGFGGLLEGFDPNAIRLPAARVSETTESVFDFRTEPELPPADLRTISGTRVNMRNGPGTTYDVVARLKLGDEVEILDDSGSGWLQLRLVSNPTVGWISASLVSKSLR